MVDLDAAYASTFFTKMENFLREKIPAITHEELIAIEEYNWSTPGSGTKKPPRLNRVNDLLGEDVIGKIGSTTEEFDEYCQYIGQA